VGVLVLRKEKAGSGEGKIDTWASAVEQLVGLILEHLSLTVTLQVKHLLVLEKCVCLLGSTIILLLILLEH
jgi:hypothetical protein